MAALGGIGEIKVGAPLRFRVAVSDEHFRLSPSCRGLRPSSLRWASGWLGVIKNGARSRLLAPEFADHEAQVFSMSMSKLRDNARRLSRTNPSRKDCAQPGLRLLTIRKRPIRERRR